MRRDPLIIGAGPAGTAAAITLGRAGCRPVLVERTTGPTDKVCGDFLSMDTIERIKALGVDPRALGAAPIRRIRLIHGERTTEAILPFPAFGLSRRRLDAALLCEAERVGARLRAGQTVRQLTRFCPSGGDLVPNHLAPNHMAPNHLAPDKPARDKLAPSGQASDDLAPDNLAPCGLVSHHVTGGGRQASSSEACGHWIAEAGNKSVLIAETVFLATGKHDLRTLPRKRSEHGAVGMKMYLALASQPAKALEGTVELTLFPGGYAGLQHVENGQAVLCVAIQKAAFQRYGSGWQGLVAAIGERSRRFAWMLGGARNLLPRPLAVAGIPYGYEAGSVSPDGLFRLGDQAAVIPSLTGDGVAIALHTGKAAAETWLAGADATAYHQALTRALAPQMRLASLLHHACMSTPVQFAVIRAAALFPALLCQAACHTRLRSRP